MAQGISLHIGLNAVDPNHYDQWDGRLNACEADAKDMAAIAKKQGFMESTLLLTKRATAAAVLEAVQSAAKRLKSGDLFWLSYSGHGGQIPDLNQDEADRQDETWVLYDRQLVDDELHQLYSKFKKGVRVLVLSDSCHSGSVTRFAIARSVKTPADRLMPLAIRDGVYRKHKAFYDKVQRSVAPAEKGGVKATVLLISGCQDNQLSYDGARNGLFTGTLRKVWKGGKFRYGYRRFRDTIARDMPDSQTPNYFVIGAANPTFESQKPFTI